MVCRVYFCGGTSGGAMNINNVEAANGTTENKVEERIIPQTIAGVNDIGLRLAHRHAIDIAAHLMIRLTQSELSALHEEIHEIFENWKIEFGNIDHGRLARGMINGKKSSVADDERRELLEDLFAWDCHICAKTPIALLSALSIENYKPLEDFREKIGLRHWRDVKAILIYNTHQLYGELQSSDCILAAMELAKEEIKSLNGFALQILPDVQTAMKRRFNKNEKAKLKAQKTAERIKAAYDLCQSTGKDFNNISVWRTHNEMYPDTPTSESTVSRCLRKLNIKQYK